MSKSYNGNGGGQPADNNVSYILKKLFFVPKDLNIC